MIFKQQMSCQSKGIIITVVIIRVIIIMNYSNLDLEFFKYG
jgi:hypothetical protein